MCKHNTTQGNFLDTLHSMKTEGGDGRSRDEWQFTDEESDILVNMAQSNEIIN